MKRREFLAALAAAAATSSAAPPAAFRLGAMDGTLKLRGKPEVFAVGKEVGLDGVELSCGNPVGDALQLADPATQQALLAEAKKNRMAVAGVVLSILHTNTLKNDPLGRKWVEQGIAIAEKMNAKVLLLPFFTKGAIETKEEQDTVAGIVKEHAPDARRRGVTLGLEDTISAEANARILDRVAAPNVKVYYDVGNSTRNGFDVLKEIRWLGRERICQVHLKDAGYLGEGKIDFPKLIGLLREIGYSGFANFETNSPSGDAVADLKRNTRFIRGLM